MGRPRNSCASAAVNRAKCVYCSNTHLLVRAVERSDQAHDRGLAKLHQGQPSLVEASKIGQQSGYDSRSVGAKAAEDPSSLPRDRLLLAVQQSHHDGDALRVGQRNETTPGSAANESILVLESPYQRGYHCWRVRDFAQVGRCDAAHPWVLVAQCRHQDSGSRC